MKLLSRTLVVVSLFAACAWSQSHPTFWRYVHPQTRGLVGLDMRRVVDSPLGQRLKGEIEGTAFRAASSQVGIDFVTDIDQILISSPGTQDQKAGAEKSEVVIALAGKFNVTALRKALRAQGARRSLYHGVELYSPKADKSDMNAALVSGSVLLLGDPESIRRAIDHHRLAGPEAARSELFQRAAALYQLHDVWWISEISPAALAGDSLPQAAMFQGVRGFEGGLSLRSGLGLELSLQTEDAEAARQMGTMLQGLLQLALASAPKDQPEAAEFLRRVRIASGDRRVTANLAYTQPELDEAFEKGKLAWSARTGEVPVAQVETKMPAPVGSLAAGSGPRVEAARAEPRVIRIFNAEGGTREISFPQD